MNQTTRILVVDDEPEILRVFTLILNAAGYDVLKASTGEHGLQLAREKRPDLVLLDVLLPDLNGVEVCKQIKGDPDLRDVFVVLVSGGATNTASKVEGLESGADDYMIKPLKPEELLARIRTIMHLRDIMAALRISEEHHRRLIDILPDAVCLIHPEGRLLAVNPRAVAMLGYASPGELLEKSAFDITPVEEHERIKADIAATLQAGIVRNAGYTLLKKNDVPIQVELSATVSLEGNGQTAGLVIVGHDVTERKRTERALRASEERFRQLADNIQDVFWMSDPAKNKIIYVSPVYEKIWGRTCESLYASPRDWVEALHPDDRERVLEAALTKQISGQYEEVYRIVRPDGSIRWIQDRAFPVRDGSGNVYRLVGIAEDITQRKETEEALRNAEARYRGIFENATEGIFRTTPEGRILVANPALARMFGYQSPQEMMSGVTDVGRQIYVSPEKRAEMKRLLLEHGAIQGFEEENYRKDGSIIWVSLNAHLVRDAGGAIQYLEGTIQDITEGKWAERVLQTQRDFGTFLSSSIGLNATAVRLLEIALQNEGIDCGGVFLVDPETGALDLVVHRGFSADFAKRASHFAADSVEARSTGAGRAISRQPGGSLAGIVQQLKRESLLAMEVLPFQHSGEVVAVLCVGSHVRGEIPAKSCQALEAITTQAAGAIIRIRAEKSLRANRRLLEKTLHSLRSAVFVVNADTMVIEECNPATTQIFGYTRDELIGRTTVFLHANEAMVEQFASHLHSAVEDKGFLNDFEFKMRRKNGTVFPTEHSMMPIRNEVGRLVSWVSVVQDITERKRVEEELRQLPWRIIEAQESERLRVARELHDGVNQVIASVKMRLRKVESHVGTLNPAAREILERCDNLLVQALEENRRIAHNLRPSDLDELGLAAACRNFCKEIQARTNLTVKCNIAPLGQRLPPAVELNLFRIVQESLTNIEKHAQARKVQLRLSFRGDSVVLKIRDDGRGFVPQRSKARRGKGHGIGLTNMRERALSLGGACEVLSTPENGTTISVRIPCPPVG
jgi:PAS domain S-box-containing protein